MTRLSFVDNLRTVLISLVVLHHVAGIWSGMDAWYFSQPPGNSLLGLVLSVFLLLNQAWFMGAFFLLSGLFTPMSYDRKGPRAFVRDRLLRLGLPLLAFYFLLNPLVDHGAIGSGPLWFVLALLVFDLSYVGYRHVVRKPALSTRPLTYRMVFLFVAVLAVLTYALRIVVPLGTWVPVIDFPTSAYLPQYVAFFLAGQTAGRRGWLTTVTDRMGRAGLTMALAGTVVFLPLALSGGLSQFLGGGTVGSFFYALWDSTFATGLVLFLLTWFRRRFNTQTRVGRYLSSHVFTVYVTHALVVSAVGYALTLTSLPTIAKVALAAAVALPASFALAAPIRRLPVARRVL